MQRRSQASGGPTNSRSAFNAPPGAGSTDWAYANFNSYGGGVFASGYSRIGAYVVASAGGHGAPGNTDALIFDFETAAWSRLANLDHTPFVSPDLGSGDTSGNPWFEINGTSVPAPSHLYNSVAYIPPALGGGRRGSFVLKVEDLERDTAR